MVVDLVASTEASVCVVFDPAALGHVGSVEWGRFWESGADREAEAGNLVLLQVPMDGNYKMRAYIEDPPPVQLLVRAFYEEHGRLLRVPSGTLCWAGIESLTRGWEGALDGSGTKASIPPGDYSADAYLVEPTEGDEQGTVLDVLTGWGCLGTIVLVSVVFFFLFTNDWRFQAPSALIVGLLALFWVPVLMLHRAPSNVSERKRRAEEFTPSLVLVLRRLDDDANRGGLRGLLLRPPAVLEARANAEKAKVRDA